MLRVLPVAWLVLLLAAAGPAPAQAPVTVSAKRFGEIALHPQRSAAAGAVSANESRVAAEVAAVIVEIPVEVGQVIAKGAVVARLEARDYELAAERARAALQSAQARLALAEQQERRARELFAKGFISKDALAQRDTEVAVLRAEADLNATALASAHRNLEKCVIRAPFRAVVKVRSAQVGELAAAGTPIATLVEDGRVEVSAAVQATDVRSLRQAQSVDFETQGARYAVTLLRVTPALARESRTQEARFAFRGAAALSGAEGRIVWRDSAPHVPPELLVRREGRLGVFALKGGRAEFVALPEAQEGRPAALALGPDRLIVTEGRHALRHGQTATVAKQ
ncbi:MAG: efflux RND transporter periplasmic adaptor subunit [Betaproteobacteria bacterium]|nr:efflux RND transporter periplasmic adaptor subunit [Betaproteobacteria bacterium]